jgi:hypothetical protein
MKRVGEGFRHVVEIEIQYNKEVRAAPLRLAEVAAISCVPQPNLGQSSALSNFL